MDNIMTKTTIYNMNTDTIIQTDATLTGRNVVPFLESWGRLLLKTTPIQKK